MIERIFFVGLSMSFCSNRTNMFITVFLALLFSQAYTASRTTTQPTAKTTTASTPSVTSAWTLNGLTITSSVPEIVPSVTSHVVVKCSFISQSESVMSLIVSQWDDHLGAFDEVVSINAFDASKPTVLKDVGAKVEGHLDQQRESFLSLAWSYPGRSVATGYQCGVATMDATGHPVSWTVALDRLPLRPMNMASLAEALILVRSMQKTQTDELNEQKAVIQRLIHEKASEDFANSMLRVHDERFHESNVTIGGHRMYWSVEGANFTFELAKMSCAITGGKVAEIDQYQLNAAGSQLQEAGMEPGIDYWIGVTNPGSSNSNFRYGWVYNSTGQALNVNWRNTPSSYTRCALFRVDVATYSATQCRVNHRVLCQL